MRSARRKTHLILWEVLVECLAQNDIPNVYFDHIRQPIRKAREEKDDEITDLLCMAKSSDQKLFEEWKAAFKNTEEPNKAIQKSINMR